MIKLDEKKDIYTDSGELVCFSIENIAAFCEKLKIKPEYFIKEYDGQVCKFEDGGLFGLDSAISIDDAGVTRRVFVIGLTDDGYVRLMDSSDKTMLEFFQEHPRWDDVGSGETLNKPLQNQILQEYRNYLLKK